LVELGRARGERVLKAQQENTSLSFSLLGNGKLEKVRERKKERERERTGVHR